MSGSQRHYHLLAKDHAQYEEAERTIKLLAPTGTMVSRVLHSAMLMHLAHKTVVGLPGWRGSFSSHEKKSMQIIAKRTAIRLYEVTHATFDNLRHQAQTVVDLRNAADSVLMSPEGGDFPDA